MLKLCQPIFLLLFVIRLSNTAQNSYLLTHYDLKVKNSEATCRLVNHANLPEIKRTLAGRGCMCDEDCVKYKDCCKDSPYYRASEQSSPPSHHCSEFTAVYLTAQCPSEWADSGMRELCENSTKPLDNENITNILPVANVRTREVYGNKFCAICNNDHDNENWIQFPVGVACGELPPEYLKLEELLDRITENEVMEEFEREDFNQNLRVKWLMQRKSVVVIDEADLYFITRNKPTIDFNKYSSKALEICSNTVYEKISNEFLSRYQNKTFICLFGPILPENANLFTRGCVPQVERKCPNNYENETIEAECSMYTNIVYDRIFKIPYRNKDCARCNGKEEESIDGEGPIYMTHPTVQRISEIVITVPLIQVRGVYVPHFLDFSKIAANAMSGTSSIDGMIEEGAGFSASG